MLVNLDAERAKQILLQILQDSPRSVATYILQDTGFSQGRVVRSPVPTYCMCGQCIIMDRDRMNLCCNRIQCITSEATFHDLCQRASVLEVAGVLNYCDQFHEEPVMENRLIRNQAYRFFILWQFSRLGHGNRRCPPSCVVARIRWRFPAPDGYYTGYESMGELDIDFGGDNNNV